MSYRVNYMHLKNRYFLLRHGESPVNLKGLVSCWPEKVYSPLTKKGTAQVKRTAKKLKEKKVDNSTYSASILSHSRKIDLIFSSDMLRTKQTAQIAAKSLGLEIKYDKRLRDINVGVFNGKPIEEAGKFWAVAGKKLSSLEYYKKRFKVSPPGGENYVDVERRMADFIKDVEKRYQGKNILVVGHKRPFSLFEKIVFKKSIKKFVEEITQKKEMENAELREVSKQ